MADVFEELTPLELDALRLRALRRRHSLTMDELGGRAGINGTVVGQLEAGLQCEYRTMDELAAIALAFHRPVADIFPGYIAYLAGRYSKPHLVAYA